MKLFGAQVSQHSDFLCASTSELKTSGLNYESLAVLDLEPQHVKCRAQFDGHNALHNLHESRRSKPNLECGGQFRVRWTAHCGSKLLQEMILED